MDLVAEVDDINPICRNHVPVVGVPVPVVGIVWVGGGGSGCEVAAVAVVGSCAPSPSGIPGRDSILMFMIWLSIGPPVVPVKPIFCMLFPLDKFIGFMRFSVMLGRGTDAPIGKMLLLEDDCALVLSSCISVVSIGGGLGGGRGGGPFTGPSGVVSVGATSR